MASTLPYGSWPSPVSVDAMLASGIGLSSVCVDGSDVYWLEARPEDDGRTTLVRRSTGGDGVEEVTPDGNVRARVMEYGGGAYAVAGGIVAWCNDTDGRVHVVERGRERAVTGDDRDFRYGDLRVLPERRLLLAVREDHHGEGEAATEVVALQLDSANEDGGRVLVSGATFYAHPEASADGRLAWVEWDHPNMPWDGTRLMVADFDGRTVSDAQQVAGGDDNSVLHPLWSGSDLCFMDDRTGFWNPWLWDGTSSRQLLEREQDCCRPVWVLGNSDYAVLGNTLVLYAYDDARARLMLLDRATGQVQELSEPFADVDSIAAGPAGIFLIADFNDRESQVLQLDPAGLATTVVRDAAEVAPEPQWVSRPESLWFDGKHGRAQAWYYPPTSPEASAPEGELPPVIVNTHGGPTGMAPGTYKAAFQYWTSRGFAILDVNYSGSAGFGREYRNRLYGQWGVADIDDCLGAVATVIERGLADPQRIAIRGGSAGGYTTLQALVSSDVFAAGVSSYGIGDLEMLATDTHKFEAHYPDKIVGPYPEARQLYLDRSPIHHVDRLSSPMLILQGLDDKVVPPNQAEAMAEAVRAKQLPVALIMFEGEGHGFRKSSTRRAVIEAQLSFFSQLFGFTPADEVPKLEIENL